MPSHIDPDCDQAFSRLIDELCEFERFTGRQSTLILIPHNKDEEIAVAVNGKPHPLEAQCEIIRVLKHAFRERPESILKIGHNI